MDRVAIATSAALARRVPLHLSVCACKENLVTSDSGVKLSPVSISPPLTVIVILTPASIRERRV